MCDSMGDFFLDAFFDEEVELRGIYNPRRHKSHYYKSNYDAFYYSRRAAVCEWCGRRYENLHQSVAETAAEARRDGWQIDHSGDGYEWYCPECRAIHDFAEIEDTDKTEGEYEHSADNIKTS